MFVHINEGFKTYYGKNIQTPVLKHLDFQIEEGEFLCITGRSGSGKSTLLNILGLLDDLTSGQYYFKEQNVAQLSDHKRACIRNSEIGYVFQSFHLISEMNVLDNVIVPLGYKGVGRRERVERAQELLESVQMSHRMKYMPSELSGGEKQRVAIARAIANKPSMLLADEPTGNLDTASANTIMNILAGLNGKRITIVMVTHDNALTSYASRVFQLS